MELFIDIGVKALLLVAVYGISLCVLYSANKWFEYREVKQYVSYYLLSMPAKKKGEFVPTIVIKNKTTGQVFLKLEFPIMDCQRKAYKLVCRKATGLLKTLPNQNLGIVTDVKEVRYRLVKSKTYGCGKCALRGTDRCFSVVRSYGYYKKVLKSI